MDQERVMEDISMTPLERLELAFQLSDLAQEIQADQRLVIKESTNIQWIELPKRAS